MSVYTASPPPSAIETPPSRRPPLFALVLGGVAIVLVLGAAAVLASPLGETVRALLGQPANSAVKLLPATTPAYMRLTPTGPQLAHVETLRAKFMAVPEFKEAWTNAEKRLATDQGLSWAKDIQPWLGPEIVLAMHSAPSPGAASPTASSALVLIATRDQGMSDQFLKKLRDSQAKGGPAFTQQQHQGHVYWGNGRDQFMTTANGFVVLASSEAALMKTLDMALDRGGAALSAHPPYQELMKALPVDRLGDLYADVASLSTEASRAGRLPLETRQREALQSVKAIAAALRAEPTGMAFESAALYDPAKLTPEQQAALRTPGGPMKLTGMLPEPTIALLAMRDLRTAWKSTATQLSADRTFANMVDSVQQATGLNLEQDVFGWMTGEVGLAMLEDRGVQSSGPRLPAGGLLAIEVADRKLVEEKLAKLKAALEKQGLTFTAQTVGGVPVQLMASAGRGLPAVGFGFVGDYLVIGTSPEMLSQAVTGPSAPLARAETYRGVDALLPKDRTSLMYADVTKLATVLDQLGQGRDTEGMALARAGLRPIKAVAMAGEPEKNGIARGRLYIYMP